MIMLRYSLLLKMLALLIFAGLLTASRITAVANAMATVSHRLS